MFEKDLQRSLYQGPGDKSYIDKLLAKNDIADQKKIMSKGRMTNAKENPKHQQLFIGIASSKAYFLSARCNSQIFIYKAILTIAVIAASIKPWKPSR